MKRRILTTVVIVISTLVFYSCSRGITIQEAADGKAKCGRHIR